CTTFLAPAGLGGYGSSWGPLEYFEFW
nr:immunoglobulin heavy chain junction region [Macaca mulatta]MOW33026.1 immunoglobulin heavy chain junction region [Macaca mulatta]MOW33193.1 immunoglobulin heavy chain junction region [Macaca mulatta]MOW33207.1 immunoglobulin heavy chain junction region [Macaca mulatta]MOW33518.1 immunoglobulin heavy chain junction region [Macaca mulatta]